MVHWCPKQKFTRTSVICILIDNTLLISILNFRDEILLLKTAVCQLSRCKLEIGLNELKMGVLASLDIVEPLLTSE